MRANNSSSEAILNNYVMRQLHENQQREMMMHAMQEMPYELQLMKALGASSPEEALAIMSAAGYKQEDIPKLLLER
jgi:hypothetical protein